ERERKRARDGRRGHHQHVGRSAARGGLVHQPLALQDSEAVLLVNGHKPQPREGHLLDRKSTRLNSSHGSISYAVFCLKKKIYGGIYILPANYQYLWKSSISPLSDMSLWGTGVAYWNSRATGHGTVIKLNTNLNE